MVVGRSHGVPLDMGQLPLDQTKPLRPKDLLAYEAAVSTFPERFDALFK